MFLNTVTNRKYSRSDNRHPSLRRFAHMVVKPGDACGNATCVPKAKTKDTRTKPTHQQDEDSFADLSSVLRVIAACSSTVLSNLLVGLLESSSVPGGDSGDQQCWKKFPASVSVHCIVNGKLIHAVSIGLQPSNPPTPDDTSVYPPRSLHLRAVTELLFSVDFGALGMYLHPVSTSTLDGAIHISGGRHDVAVFGPSGLLRW